MFDNVTNCSNYHLEEEDKSCTEKGLLAPHIFMGCGGNRYVIAVIYLLGMLWTFLGISIAADVFMAAIDRITKARTRAGNLVWNTTVANLTLMALGSSAPEILLNCIETIGMGFQVGPLGPSAVVGSACFNFLMISAVCIISIPKNQTRQIHSVTVYIIVTLFSLFAYIWLILMLVVISPNRIEVWESTTTLLLFGLLLICAYLGDRKFCCKKLENKVGVGDRNSIYSMLSALSIREKSRPSDMLQNSLSSASIMTRTADAGDNTWPKLRRDELHKQLAIRNPHMSANEIAKLAAAEITKNERKGRSYYRLQSSGWRANNAKRQWGDDDQEVHSKRPGQSHRRGGDDDEKVSTIEFAAEKFAALESDRRATIRILRTSETSEEVSVLCETIDGSAIAHEDYQPFMKAIWFEEGQTEYLLEIPLVEEYSNEPDEIFYLKLYPADANAKNVAIGKTHIAEVTIVSIDQPKEFNFEKTSVIVTETAGYAALPVVRSGSFKEKLTLKWVTKDGSAEDGKDYIGGKGELHFHPGEIRKIIYIPILNDLEVEKHETFEVKIKTHLLGSNIKKGRQTSATVTIIGDEAVSKWLAKTDSLTNLYCKELTGAPELTWGDQFDRYLNVNDGEIHRANWFDYVHHVLSFAWKFVFCFVPPCHIWGGWLTFFIVLALIGLLTALVADMATIFGCLIGLPDAITAITLVGMGTSLPDLFASRLAAIKEEDADEATVNIHGSNCCLIYLGLGIPWFIASVYWEAKGELFCVSSANLGFMVTVFLIAEIFGILLFSFRRRAAFMGYAELGGPLFTKVLSGGFMTYLWFIFLLLSSLYIFGKIKWF